MAAQKLQAQRRLLRPTKRVDSEISELQKKQLSLERRKDELVGCARIGDGIVGCHRRVGEHVGYHRNDELIRGHIVGAMSW